MVGVEAAGGHVSTGDGGHDEKRAGLDAVGDDRVLDTVQGVPPVDADRAAAGALDDGAHALQERAQIDDLGLAGGVLDHRLAVCRRGRHERGSRSPRRCG